MRCAGGLVLALGNTPSSFPPVSPRHVAAPILARVTRRLDIDHVLIAVPDLSAAAPSFTARYGLASVEGGRHPAWGTANRIVPLGASYLELVAVVDQAVAAESHFGRWVGSAATDVGRPLGWAVRTNELDSVADRLGLAVHDGSRATPSGEMLRWRSAGIDRAAVESSLPFFIEWATGTWLPGTAPAAHRAASVGIAQVRLAGDPDRIAAWVGDHTLPIEVRA